LSGKACGWLFQANSDFLDSLEVEVDQLADYRDTIRENLKIVMNIRGDLEVRAWQLAVGGTHT